MKQSSPYKKISLLTIEVFENAPRALYGLFCCCNRMDRWLVLDTETKDLVTVHTDGNEQLSVMRFAPGQSSSKSHYNYFPLHACFFLLNKQQINP